MKISVRRSRTDKKPLIVEYDFGVSTPDAAAKFNSDGPYGDVVHHLFQAQAEQQLREFVRELAESTSGTLSQAVLIKEVSDWKPKIKHHGAPPLQRALKVANSLSDDERKELLRQLQG